MRMMDIETAKRKRAEVAQEIKQLEEEYLVLTRKAYPEGSEHFCTRGGGLVKVEVVYVAWPHRVKVRSETGKEYFVDPYYLQ
jgi:hypothetical protein